MKVGPIVNRLKPPLYAEKSDRKNEKKGGQKGKRKKEKTEGNDRYQTRNEGKIEIEIEQVVDKQTLIPIKKIEITKVRRSTASQKVINDTGSVQLKYPNASTYQYDNTVYYQIQNVRSSYIP